eukprot:gene5397-biopygen7067
MKDEVTPLHVSQMRELVLVGGAISRVPRGQTKDPSLQDVCPGEHGVQIRSRSAAGDCVSYSPETHVVIVLHRRSVVADAWIEINWVSSQVASSVQLRSDVNVEVVDSNSFSAQIVRLLHSLFVVNVGAKD